MNKIKNEISVILPCLNEEKTILYCIEKAQIGIKNSGLKGEVVVADNGSTDSSVSIATNGGARIINVSTKGYGSALRGGIDASNSKYIIMGDADSTYNFEDIPLFVDKLNKGSDLVVGNRFTGGVEKNAMPLLNKYLGNPVLSYIAKKLFNSEIGDFHCGLRGFTKSAYLEMDLKSEGMEFATEMIAKAALLKLKIVEVPTTLRVSISPRKPHLKPFRDGLRHLKLMMTYSFIKLFKTSFNILLFITLPLYILSLLYTPLTINGVRLSTGVVNGLENFVLVIAILKSMLSMTSSLFPEYLERDKEKIKNRNYGILLLLMGIFLYLGDIFYWSNNNFGQIDQEINLKILSLASFSLTLGVFETFKELFNLSIQYFKKN